MNRKERRQLGLKAPEPVYNLRACDIQALKEKAVEAGCEKAFFLMLAIPCMIIHDKYGVLMRREGRESRFAEECLKLYRLYNQGYVSIEDLQQCLKEETGLVVEDLKI